MNTDELTEHLQALEREECYRVESVLKESALEATQRVMFVGRNGAEQGPFVRKYIARESGLGAAYERVFEAQRCGRRFLYIPRIEDCYTLGENFVVIMEYVQGETLHDAVYRCNPSMQLAADIFPRLCDAVLELHEGFATPLIHRDLKPSNIMVSYGGLSLIDLGIAREYKDDAVSDTRHFGTRAYAPPEQFGFGQTTVRSDVYALGMILYFCLVEETPSASVREQGFFDERIPEPVRAVLFRATEFDPAFRYENVRELKHAFCEAACACGYKEAMPGFSRCRDAAVFEGHVSAPKVGCAERDGRATSKAKGAASGAGRAMSKVKDSFASAKDFGRSALRSGASSIAASLQSAPSWLGVLWNVFILLTLFVLLVGCYQATFHPNGHDLAYPLGFLAFQYLLYCGSNFVFIAAVLLDKRRIKARFPEVSWPPFRKLAKWCGAYMLVSLIVYIAVSQPFVQVG